MTAAFHLNNREAKLEKKVYNNDNLLTFRPVPTYLGIKLDRSLTSCHQLIAMGKKLSLRVTLLRRLASSEWCDDAKTLRTASLSLVYSTVEYCALVWCHSAQLRFIDILLNDVWHSLTGCLVPPKRITCRGAGVFCRGGQNLNKENSQQKQILATLISKTSIWPIDLDLIRTV